VHGPLPGIQPIYCSDMTTMLGRLRDAVNGHDAHRVATLFAEDYQSAQPLHPGRGFGGSAQVLENWTSVFDGVPDFSAQLVASSVDGDTEWGEWNWHGHHVDGSPFAMRGVTILVVHQGVVAEARLYMEPVEAGGGDIRTAVEELYRPPPASP
jgi:ketosteroid isomerase-like protein